MTEFDWIEKYFAPLAGSGALGLKDDAACLDIPAGQKLIITTDTINEGIHFKVGTPPDKTAQKALRVNLSDLAAKGATLLGYTLNLSLPKDTDEAFIVSFCERLKRDQEQFGLSLLGGDTTRTNGPLSISITAFGLSEKPLLRSGAKAGDGIYITGRIGAGYLGLHNHSPETIAHYELPTPRLDIGLALRGVATASMDISDGLVADLGHLCRASGVGATIDLAKIPLADPAYDRLAQITGGDDYELLFTAPDGAKLPDGVVRIGTLTEEAAIQWLNEKGENVTIAKGGWQHF